VRSHSDGDLRPRILSDLIVVDPAEVDDDLVRHATELRPRSVLGS